MDPGDLECPTKCPGLGFTLGTVHVDAKRRGALGYGALRCGALGRGALGCGALGCGVLGVVRSGTHTGGSDGVRQGPAYR